MAVWARLAGALALAAGACAATLKQPTVISSTESVWNATLEVRVWRFESRVMNFTTRAYCYQGECSHPGPTLRFKPGDQVNITLVNNLGWEKYPNYPSRVINTMHSANYTNLHTHGLHIDPNVDSIFTSTKPAGGTYTYQYRVPSDHFPGLHWYHSHKHGTSALQVMGGLVGGLIIDPSGSENLPPSITDAPEFVIVLTHVIFTQETSGGAVSQGCNNGRACNPSWQAPLCYGNETSSPFSAFREYSYKELSREAGSDLEPDPAFRSSDDKDAYFVNGQYQPTVSMTLGEPTLFRVVAAIGTTHLKLEVKQSAYCDVTVIAMDGVYLNETMDMTGEEIYFSAATRIDMFITCSGPAKTHEVLNFGDVLFYMDLTSGSSSNAVTTTEELQNITFPYYLQDMRGDDQYVNDTWSLHFSQGGRNVSECKFWMGGGDLCWDVWKGYSEPSEDNENCTFLNFQGERGHFRNDSAAYTHDNRLVTTVGAVNEWKVYGLGASQHPLHLHVHHMQIVDYTEASGGEVSSLDPTDFFRIGQWRDTIPAFSGELTVRFRAADLPGETVLHCHFLRHEDLGMMDTVLVLPKVTEDSGTRTPTVTPSGAPSATPTITLAPSTSFDPTPSPTLPPTAAPTSFEPTAMPTKEPNAAGGPRAVGFGALGLLLAAPLTLLLQLLL